MAGNMNHASASDEALAAQVLNLLPLHEEHQPMKPVHLAQELGVSRPDVNRVLHHVLQVRGQAESPVPGRWQRTLATAPDRGEPDIRPWVLDSQATTPPDALSLAATAPCVVRSSLINPASAAPSTTAQPTASVSGPDATTPFAPAAANHGPHKSAVSELNEIFAQPNLPKVVYSDHNSGAGMFKYTAQLTSLPPRCSTSLPMRSKKMAKEAAAQELLSHLANDLSWREFATDEMHKRICQAHFELPTRGRHLQLGNRYIWGTEGEPSREETALITVEAKSGPDPEKPHTRKSFHRCINTYFSETVCAFYNCYGKRQRPFQFRLVYGVHDKDFIMNGVRIAHKEFPDGTDPQDSFDDAMKKKITARLESTIDMSHSIDVATHVYTLQKAEDYNIYLIEVVFQHRNPTNATMLARVVTNRGNPEEKIEFYTRRDGSNYLLQREHVIQQANQVRAETPANGCPAWVQALCEEQASEAMAPSSE
ncbi:uncharacterized protein MONBRDRAFT_28735 [Monosiga brevicollis MX1]|uniref:Uncharacterized protein n=1 Tax=Monosiga brevicollis TaxID=81824 RepID=A9V914_MONBE|nr:uncharacterized protein MONBRDRAFT_28735 [Monosiga brevicollis MX1]EDQ85975.1 predicted protein [Monosiga brevicollis MX1]|eukprot:XP_001749169.1 hypothetical protein [Monosiga brevicollis MX1]